MFHRASSDGNLRFNGATAKGKLESISGTMSQPECERENEKVVWKKLAIEKFFN